ncbi:hypothetical protein KH5H1_31480 [Corallococcus caeni]|uniref:Secreted protein n=1 Tax=Corallococcus exercitus TaxID=2316736 RepID=A0A7Y4K1C3_9BACT|nr:hypothetical protein [Corallococcus exercitus]NOK14628.1 hypothetical protein [Corallococcus exercitus]GMT99029.1 hypothetical protein KH5H1_31480 [Corallococcus sp. KH5-1]
MKRSKSLFAVAAALFLAPITAGAAPNPCDVACRPTGSCSWLCTDGSVRTTCGEYGVCAGVLPAAPSEPQASVQSAPAQNDDDASEAVCREPEARG